jgi:hypothetical protein
MYGLQWVFAAMSNTNESAGNVMEVMGIQFTLGDFIAFNTFVISV